MMPFTKYTCRVKELRPGEYLNNDRKPSQCPADRWLIRDEDVPDIIFATDHIPTSKILRVEDIPKEFLQLVRDSYGVPLTRGA